MSLSPEVSQHRDSKEVGATGSLERTKLGISAMNLQQNENAPKTMEYAEIVRLLPHRPPILLVDRVVDYKTSESILGLKAISVSEPVFAGHFPGQPIFPGIYIIEGLAQTSALLTFKSYEENKIRYKNETLLTGVEDVRFRKMVVPGDVLYYRVRVKKQKGPWAWFVGQAEVDGEIVAEATFSARTILLKDE